MPICNRSSWRLSDEFRSCGKVPIGSRPRARVRVARIMPIRTGAHGSMKAVRLFAGVFFTSASGVAHGRAGGMLQCHANARRSRLSRGHQYACGRTSFPRAIRFVEKIRARQGRRRDEFCAINTGAQWLTVSRNRRNFVHRSCRGRITSGSRSPADRTQDQNLTRCATRPISSRQYGGRYVRHGV